MVAPGSGVADHHRDRGRDLAVELVDQRNGYTIEFGDRAVISAE